MKKTILLEKLERLRADLAASPALDDSSHEQLQKLINEIERAVEEPPQEEEGLLSGEVHDLVLKIEADHPQITSALNQLASALANLGI
ncbi:DUF4404 family protein [Bythopirellula polymerisocia]|uniref:DUF4404 domain-containing protein n=1 Tax=Bythopirellula polymerisocia TaxID=2528003 RepID=A0A5C6CME5_9BACT|nr:DUF4404 family protein [Bythopirellula polymerisocia]TWU24634.1 hypothetical protein Pla144_35190 [Bythopirellula polymerisocia]